MPLSFDQGSLSFHDAAGAGWRGLLFEFNGQLSRDWTCRQHALSAQGGTIVLVAPDHDETLVLTVQAERGALVVSRTITNTGVAPLPLNSVTDGLLDANSALGLDVPMGAIDYYKLRYFHSSNIKTEKFPRFRVEHPYVRCIPYDPVHFNHDEANHVPAFGICDRDYQTILVEGDLNQVRFERSWELGLEGPAAAVPRLYRAQQRYTLNDSFELAPGESVEVSRVFYQILRQSHPQHAFGDFVAELRRHHDFRGARTRARHEGIYCTWNYGGYADINEANILLRAGILADKIPNCTHFLIDDGYQAKRNDRNAGICSFYPIPREGYDREKFPNGMSVIADQIRGLGLKPCIWLSPKIYLDSDLAAEKPEWLLRDVDGSAALLGESSFLDLSVPEARAFYLQVLDALLVDWGYEGIKYDFMTQWFLLEKIRYRNGGSGVEWRDFAFCELRKRIGDDGFFMTCIAFSAGNPFPGRYADCYRSGFDIHDGTWLEQVRACTGTLAQLLLTGRDTFLLNMDSAGFSDIPENEQRFRFSWCFITQGILEIGGLLENQTDEQFAMFNRLLAHADRGHSVSCLDDRALTGEPLPEVLQVLYPPDSRMAKAGIRQHLAFFNWSNEPRRISVACAKAGLANSPEQSGHGATLVDFWTDDVREIHDDFVTVDLPPHSATLYSEHA